MNFDELNINYEIILSQISKNGLKTQAPPWLRNIKIHIIGPRKWGVAAGILFLGGLEPEILGGGHFWPPLVLRVNQIGLELQGLMPNALLSTEP